MDALNGSLRYIFLPLAEARCFCYAASDATETSQEGSSIDIYTIGFTKRTAAEFFGTLKAAHIARLIDVRLHNSSQLAGYSKRDDLAFFLQAICNAEYRHEPMLAPTAELFDAYRKRKGSWAVYEQQFLSLMAERRIEERLDKALFAVPTVLLCSETTADRCHRRLVCEYLTAHWGAITTIHF